MKLNYEQYRARARKLATKNLDPETGEVMPSMTDQSGAEDTDINVIVKRYGVYGTVPSGTKQPQFGQDTSDWPTDLAQAMEVARSLHTLRQNLPEPLQNMPDDELMSLTPEQIVNIIKPPEKPAEEPAKEPKT